MNQSLPKEQDESQNIKRLLNTYPLCDHCIGRLCTRRENNETFADAGRRYRKNKTTKSETNVNQCELCDGLLLELSDFYKLALHSIKDYEFNTFLVGCHVDKELLAKEKEIITEFNLTNVASIKQEINEYIGINMEETGDHTVDFKKPDIMIVINTQFNVVSLQIKPLYLYGRYNKLQRGIPQTKWFCRQCHGKGCRYCKYTGKLYEYSVEEYIAKPVMNATDAADEAFHGAGREDIDVRMLGDGRPFVLELKDPHTRTLNLKQLTNEINTYENEAIKVNSLKYANQLDIARIKEARFQKVYVVKIHASLPLQKEKLKKVALSLQGTTINQQTPTRVAKRRAKKVRRRKIYSCTILEVADTMASLEIESESGTYIKEVVTGDNGKTQPNLSDLLKNTCVVKSLDVKKVKGE
ncbi:MAG: tRNA pseudouridine(54/55) synthase Pus10 [Candidatus Thermoplasmatota archaeon]|nr:tRNA pseudouridine(54/55) synthase Pus10 [Candidatus Thermoplasmatota archaeon]